VILDFQVSIISCFLSEFTEPVCRFATSPGDPSSAMPPRANKNDVKLVAPATAGDPPDFEKVHLPPLLSFTGSTLALAQVAPWLTWDPPCDPNSQIPAQATVPLYEVEAVILPVCSFSEPAQLLSPHDTCLSVPFIKRALIVLFRDGGLGTTEYGGYAEMASHLISVRAKIGAAADDAYVVDVCDLWTTSVPDPQLASLGWLRATCWGDWKSSDGSLLRAARVLAMLGCRAMPKAPAPETSRMLVVSHQVDQTFCKMFDSAALPDSFRGPQVADWVTSIEWPDALSILPISDTEALSEWRRMKAFAAGSQAEQSSLLFSVLRRGMFALPQLESLFSGAPAYGTSASSPEILRQLMAKLKLESKDPRWSDFVALDSALVEMAEIIDSVPDSLDAPVSRLHLLLEDLDAAARTDRGTSKDSAPLVMSARGDDTQILSVVPSSYSQRMNALRRSSRLRLVVEKLEHLLGKKSPNRNRMFKAAFKSQISSVAKFMAGILSSLDLGPVFSSLASYKISKLKNDVCLDPLCKYLGGAVVAHLVERYSKLKGFTLARDVVVALLWGKWSRIDFEQVLVTDVARVRGGVAPLTVARPRDQWFMRSDLISDLVRPMEALLVAIGYSGPGEFNSFSAVAEQISEAFRFSRFTTATSEDVQAKATESLHLALSDAAESWVLYWHDPAPDAPFPASFLPESSCCFAGLEDTTKTSDFAVDLAATVPRFMRALGAAAQLVPAPAASPAAAPAAPPAAAPAPAPAPKRPKVDLQATVANGSLSNGTFSSLACFIMEL
jgi:hypothetical protein